MMTRKQIRWAFALWFAALLLMFAGAWVLMAANMPQKRAAFIPPEIWREPYATPADRQFSI